MARRRDAAAGARRRVAERAEGCGGTGKADHLSAVGGEDPSAVAAGGAASQRRVTDVRCCALEDGDAEGRWWEEGRW